MPRITILTIALAGTALTAAPATAGGLLGGAGDCLCQVVNGLTGSAPGGGLMGNGSIVGNVTGSVSKTLDVNVSRSIDPRSGRAGANAGLAGTVTSVAGAVVNVNGVSKSVGLAGSASTDKEAGLNVAGVGTDHAKSLAGSISGAGNATVGKTLAITKGHGAGSGGGSINGSLDGTINKTLTVTKEHGSGGSGGSANGALNGTLSKTLSVTKGDSGGSANGTLNGTLNKSLALTKTHDSSQSGAKGQSAKGSDKQAAAAPAQKQASSRQKTERDTRNDPWEQPNRWQDAEKD